MPMLITDLDRKVRGLMWLGEKDIKDARHGYIVACFGTKRHYRKDGTCRHTAGLLDAMTPWHRARTTVHPFGRNAS